METQPNTGENPGAPNIHSEHIKDEFYKWFESRGLLSDLRAYMRQLMVKALEESDKNVKTVRQRKSSTSPKLQAINLLVVDYLFHEEYFYTVSVFASEAQILESLPQYSRYVTETVRQRRWDAVSLPRFSQQETEDILDTLRLPQTRRETQQATRLYLSGQESLLTCVVRTLASSYNSLLTTPYVNEGEGGEEKVTGEPEGGQSGYQLWSQEMTDLLVLAGVKLTHITRMQQKWAQVIEEEKLATRKEAEEEYTAQQAEWEQTTEQRLRAEVEEQLAAVHQELLERQSELEVREQGVASLAEQLALVHDDINDRLLQLQERNMELQERESSQERDGRLLEERSSRLKLREQRLEQALASFQQEALESSPNSEKEKQDAEQERRERKVAETLVTRREVAVQVATEPTKEAVAAVSTQTVQPVSAEYTQTLDTIDHEQQTSITQPDPEILLQLQTERQKVSVLQEENLELRSYTLQQRQRIDELTNRAANLASQLEESRVAVSILSGRESAAIVAPPPPPAAPHSPAFIAPTFGYNTPQRKGAGEESLFHPRQQEASPRPDGRRRPTRFAFSHNPAPTSEESSPTDEIIQNARTRIQQLGEESAAIQRDYQQFQTRLSDSVMFPPLGATPSRSNNPVMRVRINGAMPLVHLPHAPYPPVFLDAYRSRSRQFQPLDDDNEDSSSDQATDHIESMIHSRRLFTQRNIRQFERWKQFKKKFQKRDVLDHSRRSRNVSNNNTSSDDDEDDARRARRRHETNLSKRAHESTSNKFDQQPQLNLAVQSKSENVPENEVGNVDVVRLESVNKPLQQINPPVINITSEAVTPKAIPSTSNDDKLVEEKLNLELERSVRLIESVKSLLGEQNIMKPAASTLSNGSLAVESLPRDSQDDGSQNGMAKSENSCVLTVQSVKANVQREEEKIIDDRTVAVIRPSTTKQACSLQKNRTSSVNEIISVNSKEDIRDETVQESIVDLQEISPAPLSVPALSLISPASGQQEVLSSAEVAEQDRATTSVTSGSDILRELNPSKTESSESLISAGWRDDNSKHSSDFWN